MLSATKLFAVAAVLAGLASAQGVESGLPTCAQACVVKFTSGSSIGGCSNIDAKCICSSSTFLSNIACCLASACDAADQQTAATFALNFCRTAGVTGLPTAVVCASSTAPSTSPATASSSSASSVEPATSSITSSISTSSASVASSQSSAATRAGPSTSSSAAASTPTGAGSHNVAGMGAGLIGGLAVAAALL